MRNATEPAVGAAELAAVAAELDAAVVPDAVELADVLLAATELGTALLAATLVADKVVLATALLEVTSCAVPDADVLAAPPVAVPPQAASNVAAAKPLSDTALIVKSFRRSTRSLDTTSSFL